jgi:hypothetical protein
MAFYVIYDVRGVMQTVHACTGGIFKFADNNNNMQYYITCAYVRNTALFFHIPKVREYMTLCI